MKLHIVVRMGVYDRGIVGAFSTPELAQQATEAAKQEEPDTYHLFETRDYVLDERKQVTRS